MATETPRRLSRRTVLGAAAVGGIAVAAARLLADYKPPAWDSPLTADSARVTHLLRRATFGGTTAEVERALADGFAKTVDRLLETKPADPPAFSIFGRLNPRALQAWWLDWMVRSPAPFAERMTLFWHGHFTSDYRKVPLLTPWIYWQNLTWRSNSLGDFREFLYAVTVDPGMLRYLDLGSSTGDAPNENYARELMELFTMGPGNYTEDDVRAAAKALAGWREPIPYVGRTGVFVARRAYSGDVTFLGKTGHFDTRAVLDRILAQPATAPFIARKLATEFVMPDPPAAFVNRLADGFVRSRWSLKQLLHDVLTSPEFVSDAAYRSLVKSPTELTVGALKALGRTDVGPAVAAAPGMGQSLFDPPDVGGWPANAAWISSSTVLARINFAHSVVPDGAAVPGVGDAVKHQLEGALSPTTAAALNGAASDAERWFLLLASPEFQLR